MTTVTCDRCSKKLTGISDGDVSLHINTLKSIDTSNIAKDYDLCYTCGEVISKMIIGNFKEAK